MRWRPRLLPAAILAMAGLFLVKAEALLTALRAPALPMMAPARASEPAPAQGAAPVQGAAPAQAPRAPAPAPARPQAPPVAVAPPPPDPAALAERALLEQLRARRTELEVREQAVAAQEVVLQATERRLARRVEELTVMQRRIESLDQTRNEQEEAGWRGLVRTYEAMRPRDAATIFNDLEMPVLVEILDRMSERKAAPVIGAMRPERARMVTAELVRHRARRTASD
jgi:flagellar motility protein MotE (MotC chaperone)